MDIDLPLVLDLVTVALGVPVHFDLSLGDFPAVNDDSFTAS
jgi:hypothetical protein